MSELTWYRDVKRVQKDKVFEILSIDPSATATFRDYPDALSNSDAAFDAFINVSVPEKSGGGKSRQHVEWVCKQYKNKGNQFRDQQIRAEDLSKVRDDLEKFAEECAAKRLRGDEANLSKYTFESLRETIREIKKREAAVTRDQDLSQSVDRLQATPPDILAETDILNNDERGLVISPKSYNAAVWWGQDTEWCTSKPETDAHYKEYSEKGRLIIMSPADSGEWYQLHKDEPVKDSQDKDLKEIGAGLETLMRQFENDIHPADALRLNPKDKKLAKIAVSEGHSIFREHAYSYLSPELQEDPEIIDIVISSQESIEDAEYILGKEKVAEYYEDESRAVKAVRKQPSDFSKLPTVSQSSSKVAFAAVAENASSLKYVNSEMPFYRDLARKALSSDASSAFGVATGPVKLERGFVVSALLQEPSLISEIDSQFDDDKLIAVIAVLDNAENIAYFDDELAEEIEVQIAMLCYKNPTDDFEWDDLDMDYEEEALKSAFETFLDSGDYAEFIEMIEGEEFDALDLVA